MDDDRVRELIRDVGRHGESIRMETSGEQIRDRGRRVAARSTMPERNRRRRIARGPLRHAAAIAWLIGIAALVVAAVVLVGVPSSKHPSSRADATTTTSPRRVPSGPSESQNALARAVAATDSTGNFDMSFLLTGGTGLASQGLTGSGAADIDPIAMTLNHVAGADLAFSPDDAWEQLGEPQWEEYTIPAFATYAEGVVGDTAGALGTLAFCSPTGLFDLTQSEIGPTTEVGPVTVDGQSTTEYAVTIDPSSFLQAPGISSGESEAIQSAIGILGGGSISDDVYVDAEGDIVRTVSSIDGASLQVDLSNFGSAGTVTFPPQQQTIDSRTSLPSSIEICSGTGEVTGSTDTTIPTRVTPTTVTRHRCIVSSTGSGTVSPSTTIPPTSTSG